ncbi:heavy metal-binding domain-containing protein [Rufibacter sp. LB8]|uniref:heavy metal-binding domain-containing protein n=1 Tax=Rufibacter sp. LB8 TaxID=2777781 RepID=UPI00178C6961|nr:heavy metal-binding domain-containing protein [Rufibacter sp. LB8]
MKKILSISLSVMMALALGSCAQDTKTVQQEGQPATAEATADSTATSTKQMAYVCPMECANSASMNPGKCPVCGMDLVKNPDYVAPDSTLQN